MAFEIDPDRPLPDDVRRIAGEQLAGAIAALEDPAEPGLAETVHSVRKSCKRLRALNRLAPAGGRESRRIDHAVRDAARELGALRDARAVLGTFEDLLAATHGDRPPDTGLDGVREVLRARAAEAEGADPGPRLARAADHLRRVQGRLDRWSPDDDVAVVEEGIRREHREGRRAFRVCAEDVTDDALHDWRKSAKYAWHQISLLHPLAPGTLDPLARRLKDLSDGLGDDHDLAVLRAEILAAPVEFGEEAAEAAVALIDAVRADLQDRCLRLGARLYAESPAPFARRIRRLWRAWQRFGRERPVGEIAGLAAEPADRPPTVDRVFAEAPGI